MSSKVQINFASATDLVKVSGIGQAIAENIMQHRVKVGNITQDTLSDIRHIKVTQDMLQVIDFAPNPDFDYSQLGQNVQNQSQDDDTLRNRLDADRQAAIANNAATQNLINDVNTRVARKNQQADAMFSNNGGRNGNTAGTDTTFTSFVPSDPNQLVHTPVGKNVLSFDASFLSNQTQASTPDVKPKVQSDGNTGLYGAMHGGSHDLSGVGHSVSTSNTNVLTPNQPMQVQNQAPNVQNQLV